MSASLGVAVVSKRDDEDRHRAAMHEPVGDGAQEGTGQRTLAVCAHDDHGGLASLRFGDEHVGGRALRGDGFCGQTHLLKTRDALLDPLQSSGVDRLLLTVGGHAEIRRRLEANGRGVRLGHHVSVDHDDKPFSGSAHLGGRLLKSRVRAGRAVVAKYHGECHGQ